MKKEELYKHLPRMTTVEYLKYVIEAELGYININKHPENENIVILNYTDLTTYERRWNDQTLSARGLILDLTNITNNDIIVLAKPFGKFFNYGEYPEYEKDIDFGDIESIMEKMDGSLGISYFFEDGVRFATRGSFISEQAVKATEIWNRKYKEKFTEIDAEWNLYPFTFLVEIIYPTNRIVVDYKDTEDLVMLGCVDLVDICYGNEFSVEVLERLASDLKMPMAKIHEGLEIEDLIKMQKEIGFNEEGWVIKFTNGKRLKIKGNDYIEVHRLLYGISTKKKYLAWAEGRLEEYIKMLPEEFRAEIEEFERKVTMIKNDKIEELQFLFDYINKRNNDKKNFAIDVNSFVSIEDRKFLFGAYQTGIISEEMVREDIYKNYREYEGG